MSDPSYQRPASAPLTPEQVAYRQEIKDAWQREGEKPPVLREVKPRDFQAEALALMESHSWEREDLSTGRSEEMPSDLDRKHAREWKTFEAERAAASKLGETTVSGTQTKVEATPEFKSVEARIEARMASGVGDVPHPLTAPERAAAMQEARELAFTGRAASSVPENRRSASTAPSAQVTL